MFIDFFLNFAIIITLISLFHQHVDHSVVNRQSSFWKKSGYGLLMGSWGALLMQFTIDLYHGLIMDLRHIPLLYAALYAGPGPAIIAAVVIAFARLSIGGGAAAGYAMAFLVCSTIGFIVIASKIRRLWASVFSMLLLSNIAFLFISYPLADDLQTYAVANMLYWLFSFAGGFLTIHTSQYLRKTKLLFKEYEEKAYTDSLTGLNNVRRFDTAMNNAIERISAEHGTLALAMIDIDFFKKINDTYGHPTGDEMLSQLGQLLRDQLPEKMIVSRNGGEEFSVIMEGVHPKEAMDRAEQVRLAVERATFQTEDGRAIQMTISIGVAMFPDIPAEDVYRMADAALYNAKRSGRNKVCLAGVATTGQVIKGNV